MRCIRCRRSLAQCALPILSVLPPTLYRDLRRLIVLKSFRLCKREDSKHFTCSLCIDSSDVHNAQYYATECLDCWYQESVCYICKSTDRRLYYCFECCNQVCCALYVQKADSVKCVCTSCGERLMGRRWLIVECNECDWHISDGIPLPLVCATSIHCPLCANGRITVNKRF
jgi:hypothetical protein